MEILLGPSRSPRVNKLWNELAGLIRAVDPSNDLYTGSIVTKHTHARYNSRVWLSRGRSPHTVVGNYSSIRE